mmetsp:Transcript_19862/g.55167  ORF Transcript_19862/g.55167 Transcript_19862/m.55167 type:complete len:108 (+) Transcript_19862:244-567(+)
MGMCALVVRLGVQGNSEPPLESHTPPAEDVAEGGKPWQNLKVRSKSEMFVGGNRSKGRAEPRSAMWAGAVAQRPAFCPSVHPCLDVNQSQTLCDSDLGTNIECMRWR